MFDFDGVLADSEQLHFRAWSQTLAPLGYSVTWEFYLANCVGVADDHLFPRVFPEAHPERLVIAKRQAYREALDASPPILEATAELIRELAGSYPLAVVSSSARTEVELPLHRAAIADCFRMILTREDVERIKPNPEPYLKAALRMNATSPLVIEDSASGIAAGKAAGFQVLEITSPAQMPSQVRAHLGREAQ